jgi:hypothetical protein
MRLFAVPRRALFLCATLALLSFVAFGCSDDDDDDNPMDPGPGTQSTQLTGTFVGSNDGGTMTVTIPLASAALAPSTTDPALAHDVAVTGTLSPDAGGTIGLTGIYNEENDSLYVTGGGYVMGGEYDPAGPIPGIAGVYLGPSGAGGFGLAVGGSGTVTVYCGTYVNDDLSASGRLNVVVVGNLVSGAAVVEGEVVGFEGTITGTAPDQTISVNQDVGEGAILIAEGDFNATAGTITNGTWRIEVETVITDFGTWSGSTSCQQPGN